MNVNDPDVDTADIGFTPALDLVEGRRAGDFTSEELVSTLLHRIAKVDDCADGLKSVLAISTDALDQAKACDRESSTRMLHGIPVLIKDNIQAIGLPATAGSLALAGRKVIDDAPLVSKLRDAGAIILGSTNLTEWANIRSTKATSGWSAIGGLTANPWNYKHSAGGSSSGSGAAVAAGLIPFAIGTETDGSIVCPASLNGVVGIKPTVGLVSAQGVIPISTSQDSPGPIARNVHDAALLLEALSGQAGLLDACDNDEPLRIGVAREWLCGHDGANQLFEETVKKLAAAGITCIEIVLPKFEESVGEDEVTVLHHELVADLDSYLAQRAGEGVKSLAEVIAFNIENPEIEMAHFKQEQFDLAVNSGGRNEKYQSARARNLDWAINRVLTPALTNVDVLIGVPYGPAWLSNLIEGDDYSTAGWMTHAPAIAGWPIGSLPMGLVDGLPVGLGVAARANDEKGLVRAMAIIERVLDLGEFRPSFIR
jgi:amidase